MPPFLEKHKVLLPTQFGFHKHTFPAHALLDLVGNLYDQLNSINYVGLLHLDLKKAFDTVSHEILWKLDRCGICGSCFLLHPLLTEHYLCLFVGSSPLTYQ